jgi:hypothetical protein
MRQRLCTTAIGTRQSLHRTRSSDVRGQAAPVKDRRDLRPLTLSSHHMQVSVLKIYTLGAAVAPPQGEPGRARAPSGTRGKAEAPLGRGRPARDAVAEPHRPGHWSATLAFVRHSASRGWARLASSASRRQSPTRSITRSASACATCRSHWINCSGEPGAPPQDQVHWRLLPTEPARSV